MGQASMNHVTGTLKVPQCAAFGWDIQSRNWHSRSPTRHTSAIMVTAVTKSSSAFRAALLFDSLKL